MDGAETAADHKFACMDVTARTPRITFSGATWPQVMYTHPTIAPWLRDNFGYHAAYLMGNYLFGTAEKPPDTCWLPDCVDAVEGFQFRQDLQLARPRDFGPWLRRCGVDPAASVMVTNDQEPIQGGYREIDQVAAPTPDDSICQLRKLMSARRIVHTFGSRFGFWATALQGSAGGFVNVIDQICVNTTNSQQGSLWHTFCPHNKWEYIFRSNSWLYVCGTSAEDIKVYAKYLLW
jgi:hypothetical protein